MGVVLPHSCHSGGAWARFGLWKGPSMERGLSIELLTKTRSCRGCVGQAFYQLNTSVTGFVLSFY